MSLRDDIARRLWDVACDADDSRDLGGVYLNRPGVSEAVADEVIRLMEWARTQCTGEHWEGDARDGMRHIVDRSEQPLTLPPEDWKP